MILELGRQSLEYSRRMDFIQGDPGALMLVEFYGESRSEVEAKIETLEGKLRQMHLGYATTRALESAEQLNIWKVRKGSQGLLMSVLGDKKPIAFVEDPA